MSPDEAVTTDAQVKLSGRKGVLLLRRVKSETEDNGGSQFGNVVLVAADYNLSVCLGETRDRGAAVEDADGGVPVQWRERCSHVRFLQLISHHSDTVG